MTDTVNILRKREQFREQYWLKKDPIIKERLLWRAQTFRHMVHLLPGQSILELGSGNGLFTKQLHIVSRGENHKFDVTLPIQLPGPHTCPAMSTNDMIIQLIQKVYPKATRLKNIELVYYLSYHGMP